MLPTKTNTLVCNMREIILLLKTVIHKIKILSPAACNINAKGKIADGKYIGQHMSKMHNGTLTDNLISEITLLLK